MPFLFDTANVAGSPAAAAHVNCTPGHCPAAAVGCSRWLDGLRVQSGQSAHRMVQVHCLHRDTFPGEPATGIFDAPHCVASDRFRDQPGHRSPRAVPASPFPTVLRKRLMRAATSSWRSRWTQ